MIRNIKNARLSPDTSYQCSTFTFSGVLGMAIASLLLVACASTPPPTQQITAAEVAIGHAEQAQVADYASPELSAAREKLAAARAAVVKEDMKTAKRLAEQAALDADLATAKLSAAKAKTVNDEMLKSTSVIKQEMQRNPGVK